MTSRALFIAACLALAGAIFAAIAHRPSVECPNILSCPNVLAISFEARPLTK